MRAVAAWANVGSSRKNVQAVAAWANEGSSRGSSSLSECESSHFSASVGPSTPPTPCASMTLLPTHFLPVWAPPPHPTPPHHVPA